MLNVVAADRPGIVAHVSRAIVDLGGNIDACSQTVLRGYFTLIIMVSLPEPIKPDALAEAVAGDPAEGLDVVVRPFVPEESTEPRQETDRFVLTTFGGDRPGIVQRFAAHLAEREINIIDLYGERRGENFVVIGQLEVPRRLDIARLQADLQTIADELDFTVRLQHENVFIATNQLRLTGACPQIEP